MPGYFGSNSKTFEENGLVVVVVLSPILILTAMHSHPKGISIFFSSTETNVMLLCLMFVVYVDSIYVLETFQKTGCEQGIR